MRLSRYFLPTLRETPKEAEIPSHQYMLRAGMVRQSASGIYSWLPFGLAVLEKIAGIVREEQTRIGAVEMLMPTIQSADLWRESGRYEDYGQEMLRIEDRHGRDMLYGPTNEELITDIIRREVKSYKDLGMMLFHTQWKFRDEIRPRFGVMRGREFLMKDAYSFDISEQAARQAYYRQFSAYLRSFARMGLNAIPMRADTGPIGGDLSHEFLILADTGESAVFFDRAFEALDPMVEASSAAEFEQIFETWTAPYAATDEIHDESAAPDALLTGRGIEVGHIFFFGDKYSRPMKAVVQNPEGVLQPIQMGSYGIGISRLAGAIIEASHDENGIIWPDSVAPFRVGIINLRQGDDACDEVCDALMASLHSAGIEALYDDTGERAGAKFAQMDLIGLPWQIAVGPRGVKQGVVELKNRRTGEKSEVSPESALARLSD